MSGTEASDSGSLKDLILTAASTKLRKRALLEILEGCAPWRFRRTARTPVCWVV
jgi:hypothetical protein